MKKSKVNVSAQKVSADLFQKILVGYRERIAKVAKALDAVEQARASGNYSKARRLLIESSEDLGGGLFGGVQLMHLLSSMEGTEAEDRSRRKASLN